MPKPTATTEYPYKVIGENYRRPVPDGQAVIMVDTIDDEYRDAIPSLLLSLPNLEELFSPADVAFIKEAMIRSERWLAVYSKCRQPKHPEKCTNPYFSLLINKNFRGRYKRQ